MEYRGAHVIPLAVSFAMMTLLTFLALRGSCRHARTGVAGDGIPHRAWIVVLRHRWWIVAGFTTFVFLAANNLLVRGIAPGKWDVDGQFYPYFVLVADHARSARLVTWDPWTQGGLPAMGDPQLGALSPLTNAFGLVFGGTSRGFVAYWLFVWWLGGAGILLLARHLRAPAWGACIVALGFLFNGVYTGNAQHTPWIAAYSFLPLVVWRLDRAIQDGSRLAAGEAGALWGLSALAGYPAVVLITAGFCSLWALGRVACADDSPPAAPASRKSRTTHAIVSLVVMAAVGLLILAPTYLAFFYEGAGSNPRVGTLDRATALRDPLPPPALVTVASPYMAALNAENQGLVWPESNYSMVDVYVGVTVVVFALFALVRRRTVAWRWWILGIALCALSAAVGSHLPVRGWLYDWAFPTRFFRHTAVFRLHFMFGLCVLALMGTRDFQEDLRSGARRVSRWFVGATAVSAVAAALAVDPFLGSAWESIVPPTLMRFGHLHLAMIWLGLTGIVAVGLLLRPPQRAAVIPVLLMWLAGADALLTSRLGVSRVLGYFDEADRWRALDAAHSGSLDLRDNGWRREETACPRETDGDSRPRTRCRRNDQLITKVPVLEGYATEWNPRHFATVDDVSLRRAATRPPRH
ncbi:MAG TPA: hypothetical protein VGL09_04340, partial [Methylomirabilota bacterium]